MTRDRALGFHSLTEEIEVELSVDGSLPAWLSGTLVRNGPGAFELGETAVGHWFDGLAMLHEFSFGDGVAYRNRFLRTDTYEAALAGTFEGGFATSETTLRQRLRSFLLDSTYDNANVIVERVGRFYLALTETPRWIAFDPTTLETHGYVQYAGPEPTGNIACAHLHWDPLAEEWVTFETAFGSPSKYHVYAMTDPADRRTIASIPVDRPAYMHSFALTPNYVVLTEFPLVVDPLDFFKPGRRGPFIENYEWRPERGTRFLVVDRETGDLVAEPRTEAFFGFHHANAYEDNGELVVDLETVPDAESLDTLSLDRLRAGEFGVFGGALERFRIAGDEIDRETIYEGSTALPTVSPERWCQKHRYVYAQDGDQPITDWPRAVSKIDTETGHVEIFDDGENYFSEPIFVPRPGGTAEDDGVVLTVMLDVDAERSVLVVLGGESFSELARAPVPHAIPFDFHGRYFPEPS